MRLECSGNIDAGSSQGVRVSGQHMQTEWSPGLDLNNFACSSCTCEQLTWGGKSTSTIDMGSPVEPKVRPSYL